MVNAFDVQDLRPLLAVLPLGHAHAREGVKVRQHGASDEDGMLPVVREENTYPHRRRSEPGNLVLHAFPEAWKQGAAAGEDNVGIQLSSDVDLAQLDTVVQHLVQSSRLPPQ
eukprot:CAMPEP_0176066416 /NCGR_PEP_ID=MMETSP0120_2-20121206/33143_1 /TAXON_ID=160619 /ORGANISM="Kryptoperidinium foliaceum, Strain CCMP 1326" /LENGTH=111 /DNA_ID=CAMNT_0017400019 /DNA_START=37 /DNA_END=373 /DNA_ORIENTATION=-